MGRRKVQNCLKMHGVCWRTAPSVPFLCLHTKVSAGHECTNPWDLILVVCEAWDCISHGLQVLYLRSDYCHLAFMKERAGSWDRVQGLEHTPHETYTKKKVQKHFLQIVSQGVWRMIFHPRWILFLPVAPNFGALNLICWFSPFKKQRSV